MRLLGFSKHLHISIDYLMRLIYTGQNDNWRRQTMAKFLVTWEMDSNKRIYHYHNDWSGADQEPATVLPLCNFWGSPGIEHWPCGWGSEIYDKITAKANGAESNKQTVDLEARKEISLIIRIYRLSKKEGASHYSWSAVWEYAFWRSQKGGSCPLCLICSIFGLTTK